MKNFPVFTTQAGVASLILEQVPFHKTAYIRIQSSTDYATLLKECLDFCKAVCAETVYATGDERLASFGNFASIIRMERPRQGLFTTDAILQPVTPATAEDFRRIHNNTMCRIPNAAWMTTDKIKDVIDSGECYFVYQKNTLIGIGIAGGSWIHSIISMQKGAGETVLRALNQALRGDTVCVELIDCNLPAKRLYERLGFEIAEVISNWYKIL